MVQKSAQKLAENPDQKPAQKLPQKAAPKLTQQRSGCPINMTVELLGDRWSLLVIRDVMFADRHTFADLHTNSAEGIATNILTDRLKRLVAAGVLRRTEVPGSRNKVRYDLTERGIDLVPVLTSIGGWGAKHLNVDPDLCRAVQDLQAGGSSAEEALMRDLRERDLEPAESD